VRTRHDEVLVTMSTGNGGDERVLVTTWLGEEVKKKFLRTMQ
jgi:hypothetical protein